MADQKQASKTVARILLVSGGQMFGPFETQDIAQEYIDNGHIPRAGCEMYSLWEPTVLGTAERAHECGTRLLTLDETSNTTSRKAASA
jgi:hypothetical protein